MQPMMDFQFAKKRHEELLREAEMNRRVKALRATGKRRASRRSALASELTAVPVSIDLCASLWA